MVNFTGFSEIFVDINFVDIMFKTITMLCKAYLGSDLDLNVYA